MRKKLDFVFVFILLVLLVSVPAGILLGDPDGADVLFYENRTPAAFPEIEMTAIWDGRFMTQVDDFMTACWLLTGN